MSDTVRVESVNRRLVEKGRALLDTPRRGLVKLAQDPEADSLLNDLTGHPHAYVLACLVDRNVRAEVAWMLPLRIKERTGSFDINDLARLDERDWLRVMTEPSPAHRFPTNMSRVVHRAITRIVDQYGGDASRIWSDSPSSAALVRRFLEFHGAGPKIATMAANILVREFRVKISDFRYIDISADVHVVRVMSRLGLVRQGAGTDEVVYAARELNPDFPGIIDPPIWFLGRDICKPKPRCAYCYLSDLCPHRLGIRGGEMPEAEVHEP